MFISFLGISNEDGLIKSDCERINDSLQIELEEYTDFNRLKAIEVAELLLAHAESCKDDLLVLNALDDISWAYFESSDFANAMYYAKKLYDLAAQLNFYEEQLTALNIQGLAYLDMKQLDKAFDYFDDGIERAITHKDSAYMSVFYNNIAIVYDLKKDFENAERYYFKTLSIEEEFGFNEDIAVTLINICDMYFDYGKIDLSKEFELKASRLIRDIYDNHELLFALYSSIANKSITTEDFKLGLAYIDSAMSLTDYSPSILEMKEIYELRSKLYFSLGNFDKAYLDYVKMGVYKDSILNSDILSEINNMQIKAIKEKSDAQLEDLKKDNQIKDLELEKNKVKKGNYLLILALALLALLFTLFMFYQIKKSSIKLKKRSKIIAEQNIQIGLKNKQLEDFNKSMLDSINYAKRLQYAILPNENELKKYFSFGYLFLPKDVVSGDFYWHAQPINYKKGDCLFAVADCTGQGVPGAMVSVVCANALNKAVYDDKITLPGKILDRTKELVEETFATNKQLKDGMDISLIAIQQKQLKPTCSFVLSYAGANNPLWIIRKSDNDGKMLVVNKNSSKEAQISPVLSSEKFNLFELKPDKQPIGYCENNSPFQTQEVTVYSDDILYLFTDGIYSQFEDFNNTQEKKLNKSHLIKHLLNNSNQPVDEQIKHLYEFLINRKEILNQEDDICFFAIRLNQMS